MYARTASTPSARPVTIAAVVTSLRAAALGLSLAALAVPALGPMLEAVACDEACRDEGGCAPCEDGCEDCACCAHVAAIPSPGRARADADVHVRTPFCPRVDRAPSEPEPRGLLLVPRPA
jgi:hypothetical protein